MPAITIPISALHEVVMRALDQGIQKKIRMELTRDGMFPVAQAEVTIVLDMILTMPDGERKIVALNMSGSLCMEGSTRHIEGHEVRVGELEFTLNK